MEFDKVFLLEKGRILGSVKVDRSRTLNEVIVAVAEDLKAVLKHNEIDALYTRVSLPDKVDAPVRQGSIMGTVSIFQGDKIIAETQLITLNSAQKMRFSDYMKIVVKKWIYTTR
jgi:D-alanyl-D-alanine carboxypeptidase (penicillin-binding protein 5/6)